MQIQRKAKTVTTMVIAREKKRRNKQENAKTKNLQRIMFRRRHKENMLKM